MFLFDCCWCYCRNIDDMVYEWCDIWYLYGMVNARNLLRRFSFPFEQVVEKQMKSLLRKIKYIYCKIVCETHNVFVSTFVRSILKRSWHAVTSLPHQPESTSKQHTFKQHTLVPSARRAFAYAVSHLGLKSEATTGKRSTTATHSLLLHGFSVRRIV